VAVAVAVLLQAVDLSAVEPEEPAAAVMVAAMETI
jgi:hypothetical protein